MMPWDIIFVTERRDGWTDGRKDRLVSRGASTEDLIRESGSKMMKNCDNYLNLF